MIIQAQELTVQTKTLSFQNHLPSRSQIPDGRKSWMSLQDPELTPFRRKFQDRLSRWLEDILKDTSDSSQGHLSHRKPQDLKKKALLAKSTTTRNESKDLELVPQILTRTPANLQPPCCSPTRSQALLQALPLEWRELLGWAATQFNPIYNNQLHSWWNITTRKNLSRKAQHYFAETKFTPRLSRLKYNFIILEIQNYRKAVKNFSSFPALCWPGSRFATLSQELQKLPWWNTVTCMLMLTVTCHVLSYQYVSLICHWSSYPCCKVSKSKHCQPFHRCSDAPDSLIST